MHLTSILPTSCKLYLSLKTESLTTQHHFSFIIKTMFVYTHAEKDLERILGGGIMGIFPFFKEPSLLLTRIFPPFPHGGVWITRHHGSIPGFSAVLCRGPSWGALAGRLVSQTASNAKVTPKNCYFETWL